MIVDDHRVVRQGLEMLLGQIDDIEVVESCGGGTAAIHWLQRYEADVVLMDLAMPDLGGVEATRQIRQQFPGVEVLVLTSFLEEQLLRDALEAGACGYLLKKIDRDDLAAAIRAAARGQATVDPEALPLLFRPSAPRVGDDLTGRERDVLALLVDGLTNDDIAGTLGISIGTVRVYVSNVLAKLDVDNRTAAAVTAVQHGLVGAYEAGGGVDGFGRRGTR